jgi:site-specific DNA recombinase
MCACISSRGIWPDPASLNTNSNHALRSSSEANRELADSGPHDRCRYPAEYALPNEIDHPRTVYDREDEVMPTLDARLAPLFDPENLDETCAQLAAASGPTDADEVGVEAARRKLEDCDDRLGKYRAALDNGADPTIVATWIAEVQGEPPHR